MGFCRLRCGKKLKCRKTETGYLRLSAIVRSREPAVKSEILLVSSPAGCKPAIQQTRGLRYVGRRDAVVLAGEFWRRLAANPMFAHRDGARTRSRGRPRYRAKHMRSRVQYYFFAGLAVP